MFWRATAGAKNEEHGSGEAARHWPPVSAGDAAWALLPATHGCRVDALLDNVFRLPYIAY